MEITTAAFALLMLLACVVAMLARRLHVPYSAGLVMAGVALAAVSPQPDFAVAKDLLMLVLLPPLVFEAAFHMHWSRLRKELWLVGILASVGVLLSMGATAVGMHWLANWDWLSAAVFGMLIAATDPVSVIATFKEARVKGRLELLVTAESLLNDGTAALGFALLLAGIGGGGLARHGLAVATVTMLGGSIFCGVLVSVVLLSLVRHAEDHLVEVTLAMVAAYGSFLMAERLHLSGILATLATGLIYGNTTSIGELSRAGRAAIGTVMEFTAFVANSLIFLLIGVQSAHRPFWALGAVATAGVASVLVGRAVAVYPLCAVFRRTTMRVPARQQHILFWGGLRGALALALALSVPDIVPRHDEIVTTAFAVVTFSVFAQGMTMTPLLRRLGELRPTPAALQDESGE